MQTSSFVSAAALVIACACGWITLQRSRADRDEVASLRANAAAGSGEPQIPSAPRLQVVYLPPSSVAATSGAPGDAAVASAATSSAPAARLPMDAAQVADHVEADFRGQADDASWSPHARQDLGDFLHPLEENGAHVRSVECRTSFCRVEMLHATPDAYKSFAARMTDPSEVPWNGAMFSTRVEEREDGSSVTVTYMAREGYDLPRPEGG